MVYTHIENKKIEVTLKLPFFTELKFKNLDESTICQTLDQYRVSFRPIYFRITNDLLVENPKILKTISNYFKINQISTSLPYPFFVINIESIIETDLPHVTSFNELPGHFKGTTKRLSPREEILLSKLEILINQVKYISTDVGQLSDTKLFQSIANLKKQVQFLSRVIPDGK